MRRSVVLLATAALVLGATADARADSSDVARQHFEAGKKLRDEGDCVRAIPEFEKSVAADKSIGAFYNLAYCHEQLAHRQAAYEAYRQAQTLARGKHDERLGEIGGALTGLLETPHIRLILPQPLPEGLQIKVDDELVPVATYQTEIVVFTKPNRYHIVVVTAPGYDERRESVETKQPKAIDLHRTAVATSAPAASPADVDTSWSATRWLGVGLFAAGVVGGVATTFIIVDHLSTIEALTVEAEACNKVSACVIPANQKITDENTRATIVGGAVGAVSAGLLVSGAILYLGSRPAARAPTPASPPAAAPASVSRLQIVPRIGQTEQGLSVVGRF